MKKIDQSKIDDKMKKVAKKKEHKLMMIFLVIGTFTFGLAFLLFVLGEVGPRFLRYFLADVVSIGFCLILAIESSFAAVNHMSFYKVQSFFTKCAIICFCVFTCLALGSLL